MKYVIFRGGNFVLIPKSMKHSDVRGLGEPISAGFCRINSYEDRYGFQRISVKCYGHSESLGLKVGEKDELILFSGLNSN